VKRLKVLMSAYACEPGKGSEPGVGWNVAREMARHHDVWVITRANNRPAIEAALDRDPVPGLRFFYYDLPPWARWWKRGQRGVQLYYYLWQCGAHFVARALHRDLGFHLAHHVTFMIYWWPSFLALLPVPFVWGPVGGGESAPKALWGTCGPRGMAHEILREAFRWLGEHDPLVRLAARKSALALGTTRESAERIRALGAGNVTTLLQTALPAEELVSLERLPEAAGPLTFMSVGRLIHWKGFHLALRALAAAGLNESRYLIVGDGPDRKRLEGVARDLGVMSRVRFTGTLSRQETLRVLGDAHVLVHPSLHDSGGWVCLEAMAAGKPVICLDLGGPAVMVTEETGIKVSARTPEQVIADLSSALRRLAEDPGLRISMGAAARKRVEEQFSWRRRGEQLQEFYERAVRTAEEDRGSRGAWLPQE